MGYSHNEIFCSYENKQPAVIWFNVTNTGNQMKPGRAQAVLSIHVKYRNRENKDKILIFKIVFTLVGRMEMTGKR